jgi:hypothetical protein
MILNPPVISPDFSAGNSYPTETAALPTSFVTIFQEVERWGIGRHDNDRQKRFCPPETPILTHFKRVW